MGTRRVQIGTQILVAFVLRDPGNGDKQEPQHLYTRFLQPSRPVVVEVLGGPDDIGHAICGIAGRDVGSVSGNRLDGTERNRRCHQQAAGNTKDRSRRHNWRLEGPSPR